MSIRFKQSSIILLLAALLFLAILSNRSWVDKGDPVPAAMADSDEAAPPAGQGAESDPIQADDRLSEQHLSDRVEARWAALAEGDFAKAYEYETPGYRDTVTPQQYPSQFGRAVRWIGAEVLHLDVSETGDRAEVKVLLEYEARTPVGDTYTNRRPLNERWIASEGDWWYVRD
ncbi:MAG: hypothetical protein VBE63_00165 [Lamprobacter sp.]|uniref:hypothetical protein n=1 Tax=Lamprobacter sp. TaxID=3100796 RepID=UPI002B25B40D|nr:hypothetical protein [Lamprobacter sp.]MEA3638340.1 hypothetical protein [Lamprobacter sp.]